MEKKSKKMTKNNFKFFLKKPFELAESSELPASGLAKHPCINFILVKIYHYYSIFSTLTINLALTSFIVVFLPRSKFRVATTKVLHQLATKPVVRITRPCLIHGAVAHSNRQIKAPINRPIINLTLVVLVA